LAEQSRRRLLRATDNLLEGIERLRLSGVLQLPEPIRARLDDAARQVGDPIGPGWPATLDAAHEHVFRIQGQILRGGGRPSWRTEPAARSSPNLPELSLPGRHQHDTEAEWRHQVRLVVQRAHDRAVYLAAQTRAARGAGDDPLAATRGAEAESAQQSFGQLSRDAERITRTPMPVDSPPTLPTNGRLRFADLVIDIDRQEVHQAGAAVRLTRHEQACLTALVANRGRVVTREAMQHLVSGAEPTLPIRSRTLDVHFSRVRSKLGHPSYLETIAGVGWRVSDFTPREATTVESSGAVRERRRAERRVWARGSPSSPPPTTRPAGPSIDRPSGRLRP
jgi:DNA-binding response OmpR family regulator